MASRFTNSEKWADSWFRNLSPYSKTLYWYLWDACDIAGFWEIDLEHAVYHTKISEAEIKGAFKGLSRGYVKNNGFIWIRRFLYHQRNLPLNKENKAHKGILARIEEHKSLFPNVLELIEQQGASKGLLSPSSISKGIGKGKGTSNNGEISKKFVSYWNSKPNLPKIRAFAGSRVDKLKARMKEPTFSESWKEAIDKIDSSPFCCGNNDRKWKADASWMIANSDNYVKVLEGKYDGKKQETNQERARRLLGMDNG